MSISHDHSTSYFYFGFRSQETPIDGQPPALPPKQFKKNSWNQIHHSHSQQELDNHINETFDVPASPEKSTVSFWIQLNHSAFYWMIILLFMTLVLMHFRELLCLCFTLQHFHYTGCLFASSCYCFHLLELVLCQLSSDVTTLGWICKHFEHQLFSTCRNF